MNLVFKYPAQPDVDATMADIPVTFADGRRVGRVASVMLVDNGKSYRVMLEIGNPEMQPQEVIAHATMSALGDDPLPAGLTHQDLMATYLGSNGVRIGLSAVAHLVAMQLLCKQMDNADT
jgi:hypothetical protein